MKSLSHDIILRHESNLYVFILKCVLITSIEHYMEVLLDNKKQNKQKTKKIKHYLKDFMEQFFNFSYESVIHDKIILFDAALLAQKITIRAGYAERSIK